MRRTVEQWAAHFAAEAERRQARSCAALARARACRRDQSVVARACRASASVAIAEIERIAEADVQPHIRRQLLARIIASAMDAEQAVASTMRVRRGS